MTDGTPAPESSPPGPPAPGPSAPGPEAIREVHLEVPRQARLALVGPTPGSEGSPEELWIVLHGYRQLARRFLRPFRGLAGPDRLIVAPEGHSRFYLEGAPGPHRSGDPVGASWMTREDREMEIRDYVAYLDRVRDRFAGPGTRLTVLGFSQGVHTAARWVALGSAGSPREGGAGGEGVDLWTGTRLVLWGAALPRDLPRGSADRFRALSQLILVRGEQDALRNRGDEEWEEEWLSREEIPCQVETHPGGHRIAEPLLRDRLL
jgi:predicted esterase